MRVWALADMLATTTAVSNDVGYDQVFAVPLRQSACEGDVVVALSVSGESPNLLAAARTAHDMGGTVVALTGRDGSSLARLADLAVPVASDDYGQVEDVHSWICHAVTASMHPAPHRRAGGPRWRVSGPAGRGRLVLGLADLCMYPGPDLRGQLRRLLGGAADAGVALVDTADAYCPDEARFGLGESVLAEALAALPGRRPAVMTKGGHTRHRTGWGLDGSADYLLRACAASVARLGGTPLDLYALHRPDPRCRGRRACAVSPAAWTRVRPGGSYCATSTRR